MTTGRSVRHTSKETRKTKTKTTTTRVKAKEGKTIAKTINRIQQRQPQRQSMMILGKTSVGLILAATVVGNSFFLPPQFSTVDDIPKSYFQENKIIYGKVERVIDGDTIRVRHCPTRFVACPRPSSASARRRIYDSTLSVRLYGIDCPELQKRKNADLPSQPYAKEAREFTSDLILDEVVQIKLLRRDQYSRAVGKVQTSKNWFTFPPFSRKDVSMELTKRGLATLYTGGGAEYDGNRKLFEQEQERARKRRLGIFSNGGTVISPAEYKKQQKAYKQQQKQAAMAVP